MKTFFSVQQTYDSNFHPNSFRTFDICAHSHINFFHALDIRYFSPQNFYCFKERNIFSFFFLLIKIILDDTYIVPFCSNCAIIPKLFSIFHRVLFYRESKKLCKSKRYSLITRDTLLQQRIELSTGISGAGVERLLYDDTFREGGQRSNKLSRNKGRCNIVHSCLRKRK